MKTIHIRLLGIAIILSLAFKAREMPHVFLIGDSISMGYSPYLETYLKGQLVLERKEDDGATKNLDIPRGANGGDSKMVLTFIREKVKDKNFHTDMLLLNCGMHDIKRDIKTNKIAVEEDEYRQNLQNIYSLVTQKGIKLIWVSSTQVIDSVHNRRGSLFYRYAKDAEKYNAIASEVFKSHNVPQIDLDNFTRQLGKDRFKDHVHYRDDICALQGAYIAGCLWQITGNNQQPKQPSK